MWWSTRNYDGEYKAIKRGNTVSSISDFYPRIFKWSTDTDYVPDNPTEYFRAFVAISRQVAHAKTLLTDRDFLHFIFVVGATLLNKANDKLNEE